MGVVVGGVETLGPVCGRPSRLWVEVRADHAPGRGGAFGRMLGERDEAVQISVIFPLVYVRGPSRRCIESWTRKQSLDPDSFEVIFVSPGVDPALEKLVGEHMRPQDRLEVVDGGELYALYDHGIRMARGGVVVITEAHVQAGRRVLESLLDAFADTACRAACCRAVAPKKEGYLATMEGWLFAEEVAGWGEHGHRRRLLERGFAIRREAYLAYGGFPHQYGLFAGRVFGSLLDSAGEHVPYVRRAAVVHHNSTRLDDIFEGVRSFVHGELRYRRCGDAAHVRRYFGPAPIVDECDLYRRSLARPWLRGRLARIAQRRVLRAGDLREIGRLAVASVFGFAWPLGRARAAIWLTVARIHALRPFGPRAGFESFRELWHRRLIRYHGLQFLARTADDEVSEATDRCEARDGGCFAGFYELEALGDAAFRWSRPLAALRVKLRAPSPSKVTLRLIPVDESLSTRGVALYFDGRRLEPLSLSQDGAELSAPIPRTKPSVKPRTLAIVCDPLLADAAIDGRELGLAVRSVEFS